MKVDKGFQVVYWKLSYRRKFIRTLWMTPLIIIIPLFLYFSNVSEYRIISSSAFLFIIWLLQLAYTYSNYQNEKA